MGETFTYFLATGEQTGETFTLVDEQALPDLTVSSADVQSTGQLAVRITNVGRAPFAGQVGLRITTADGEIVGVLDVDLEASPLGAGRSASINTGTVVTATGLYVIDPAGTLQYVGAIDSNPSADPADIPGSTQYVSQALAELSAGKPVSVATTQPYGCSVKYAN